MFFFSADLSAREKSVAILLGAMRTHHSSLWSNVMIRKFFAIAALMTVGVLGTGVTGAQAAPTNCQAIMGISPKVVTALCAGGTGEFRAGIVCQARESLYTNYSAWTRAGQVVTVACLPYTVPLRVGQISLRG